MTFNREMKILCKSILFNLTEPQKRICYSQLVYPESPMYVIGGMIYVDGQTDIDLLVKAICAYVNNNDAFSIRLTKSEQEVMQYFTDVKCSDDDIKKVHGWNKAFFQEWCQAQMQIGFELFVRPLYQFTVCQFDDMSCGYFLKIHHMISDGWSMKLLTNGIADCYSRLANEEEIIENTQYRYKDFIAREKDYLQSAAYSKNKKFWLEKFENLPNENYTIKHSLNGKRKTYNLSSLLSEDISNFCFRNHISENAYFVSLYLLLEYRMSAKSDLVVGTPVLGRTGAKERATFGMFVSTMPFRYQITGQDTITEYMKDINNEIKMYYINQRYPYNHLYKDLRLNQKEYNSLYKVCINYYGTKLCNQLNNHNEYNQELYNSQQLYSLQIIIRQWSMNNDIQLDVDYQVDEYEDDQINTFMSRLKRIMEQTFEFDALTLDNIDIMLEDEKEDIVHTYNARESSQDYTTVLERFDDQVKQHPDCTALIFGSNKMTYAQLNDKVNAFAGYLLEQKIADISIVCLYMKHSMETVIAILGAWRVGAAYLPLDVNTPFERVKYILKEVSPALFITNVNQDKLNEIENKFYFTLETLERIQNGECLNRCKKDSLAYIIYTSGSTGNPKGVMITQNSLANYINWAEKTYVKDKAVCPLYSSLAFDLTVTSIFVPLVSGGTIIIYDDNRSQNIFQKIVNDNYCNIIKLTPSHLCLLNEVDICETKIDTLIVGGEQLKTVFAKQISEKFNNHIKIYNEYGPTEATVGCMIYLYDCEKDTGSNVPIGQPIANTQIYLLDKKNRPVPVGVVGEMFIGGKGITKGYFNNTKLTEEKIKVINIDGEKTLYRTGDLAKFINRTTMECLGRMDDQIKIRGHRIELGEIEKHLLTYDKVKSAAILVKTNTSEQSYLVAYYVANEEINEDELRLYLGKFLPQYMIPSVYFYLKEMPLVQNGKVDKRALLQMDEKKKSATTYNYKKFTDGEKKVFENSATILNVGELRPEDNFYHLGGDSIKAIQLSSRLCQQGYKLRVSDILQYPVFKDMIHYVEVNKNKAKNNQELSQVTLSPIYQWFFEQKLDHAQYYTQSCELKLKCRITKSELSLILFEILKCHGSFCINYDTTKKQFFYNNELLKNPIEIKEYDLSSCEDPEKEMRRRKINLNKSMNFCYGILLQSCLFHLGADNMIWYLSAHHLAIDGVSWSIILNDIDLLMSQKSQNKPYSLMMEHTSYHEWVNEVYNKVYVENPMLSQWDKIFKSKFRIPMDQGNHEVVTEYNELEETSTDILLKKANVIYNTKPNELLLAALCMALHESTSLNDFLIEVENNGRNNIDIDVDITRTTGWFTQRYPIRIVTKEPLVKDYVLAVKESVRNTDQYGYMYLMYKDRFNNCVNEREMILFNYLGEMRSNSLFFDIANKKLNQNVDVITNCLEINAIVLAGQLYTEFKYKNTERNQQLIRTIQSNYDKYLHEILQHCIESKQKEILASDYIESGLTQDDFSSLFI